MAIAVAVGAVATFARSGNEPQPTPRVWVSSAYAERCPQVQRAVSFYRGKYREWRSKMGQDGPPPREWRSCVPAEEQAATWKARAEQARASYRRQFDWRSWLPRGWYGIGSCETGYGGDPNWQHDSGTYVSAFGIYRPPYADDAHRIGNMSWDETVRARGAVPTPWEQYQAALSHYRANGGLSGWGCKGAFYR